MTTAPVTPGNSTPHIPSNTDLHAISMLASAISAISDGRIDHAMRSINSATFALGREHGPLTDQTW